MSTQVRVAVADDHNLFRAGVVELLSTFPDIEIVGQAASGAEAIRLVRDTQPDVILLDLDMPDTRATGEETSATTAAIRTVSTDTKVVILTMHDSASIVRKLLHEGVSGYLLKSAGREELYAAITAASRDQNAVTIGVSRRTATALSTGQSEVSTVLTAREVQVVELLAHGGSNRSIANELSLAEATVKRHLASIYNKLEAHTRMQAVSRARSMGLIA